MTGGGPIFYNRRWSYILQQVVVVYFNTGGAPIFSNSGVVIYLKTAAGGLFYLREGTIFYNRGWSYILQQVVGLYFTTGGG